MIIDKPKLEELIEQVEKIYHDAKATEAVYEAGLAAIHPSFQPSARNLLHYVALGMGQYYQGPDFLRGFKDLFAAPPATSTWVHPVGGWVEW